MVRSQQKEEYIIENIIVGQTIVEELNLNITVKTKPVIQNMCCGTFLNGWVPNLANLSETRTMCKYFVNFP